MALIKNKSVMALISIATISTTALSSYIHAASTIDMVVIIDESPSMAGEHNQFIGSYIQSIDDSLADQDITLNQYGLVGFGGTSPPSPYEAGRQQGEEIYRHFNLSSSPDSVWGTANEFDAVTDQLVTNGNGEEDGYRAIDYTYQSYDFRADAGASILLISDEGRDNDTENLNTNNLPSGQNEIDKAYIQSELALQNIVLHAAVNQRFTDQAGNPAFAVVGDDPNTGYAYVRDEMTGDIVKVQGYLLVEEATDTTQDDYTDLALTSGGMAIDIDSLRDAYTDAAALDSLSGELALLFSEISSGQDAFIAGIKCYDANGIASDICGAVRISGDTDLQELARLISGNSQGNTSNELNTTTQFQKLAQFQMGQMINSLKVNSRNLSRMMFNRLSSTRRAGISFDDIDLLSFSNGDINLAGENNLTSTNNTGKTSAPNGLDVGLYLRGRYTDGNYNNDFEKDDNGELGVGSDYDSKAFTIVAGGDAFVNDAFQLGLAVSYASADSDFANASGDTQVNNISLSGYSAYELSEDFFFQTSLGFSQASLESKRINGFEELLGETDASYTYLSLGFEKDKLLNDRFNLTRYAYIHATQISVDGFAETGGVSALTLDDTSDNSLIAELGVYSNYAITKNLMLDARFGLEHEFNDDGAELTTAFAVASENTWIDNTTASASTYARIGLGLNQNIGTSGIISIWGDALVGDSNYNEISFEIKYRYIF
ncbi:MAG: autotransporter outer membrane beta-barrel domain-containing protein [Cellvibrionaceae bacterium]